MANFTHWLNITDIDEYLAVVLGPKRLPLSWLVPLTSVYAITFVAGIAGNACTCLVIASNPYMQTATNCYLFNLAVADMLTLICAMPLELYSLWHQYPWQLGTFTCISRTVFSEATAYASILTIMTFSCEQYYAVCHPLHQTKKSKIARALRNIVIIWIVSFATAAPFGLFTNVNYITLEDGEKITESAWCGFPFTDPNRKWEMLMLCSTFLFFVVPATLISALYLRISLTLYRARHLCRTGTADDPPRDRIRSRMVVIKMLMTVVLAFFVCWAPYHSQRLLFLYVSLYGEWTETLRKVNQDLFSLAGCFYYFNSTVNPVLYSVMSNRFRVAFREKLCACCNRDHLDRGSPVRLPDPVVPSFEKDRPRLSGFAPRCSGTSDSDYYLAREKRSSECGECISVNFANFNSRIITPDKALTAGEDSPMRADTKL